VGRSQDIQARLRARASVPELPPLERTRAFLRSYCTDADTLDEIRDELARDAPRDPVRLRRALDGMEVVLADPQPDGTLSHLIAVDANCSLADPSDTGARDYLRQLADVLREALAASP
jgi:hypothetical protein